MDIAELDVPNLEFFRRMKAGDFDGAHAALAELCEAKSIAPHSHAKWSATIFHRAGDHAAAIAALAPLIAEGDLQGRFAVHHRARIFISAGSHDAALADFRSLLDDDHPRIVSALHDGCRIQAAWILALRGDSDFCGLFDRIPDGREYVIGDSIVTKTDLARLYRANRKSEAPRSAGPSASRSSP